jgi:DNA-binding winged helix-turn-helix (wHTH) protein/predicted ATPase
MRYHFGEFSLHDTHQELYYAGQLVAVEPQVWRVLCYLLQHRDRVVTKHELLEACWPGTFVSEAAMLRCLSKLRQVLRDSSHTPRYIKTFQRQGYRFVATVTLTDETALPVSPAPPAALTTTGKQERAPVAFSHDRAFLRPVALVGRAAEWVQLHQWFATAQHGTCQLGFIAGEPGIGRSALIETFVSHLLAAHPLWIGYGQCIEHYGMGEPYLPLLEAFGRLCQGPEGSHIKTVFCQYAPSWLVQMPALLTPQERRELAVTTSGSTQVRMLRELADALQMLTAERPLVLILDDVHWSDQATMAWLAYVAKRRACNCLLVLSAYRPVEAMAHAPALLAAIAELAPQDPSMVMRLDALSEAAVGTYLAQRLGTPQVPAGLTTLLHQRTRGNPFFLRTIIDELLRHGLLQEPAGAWSRQGTLDRVAALVPTGIRALIEQQIARLPLDAQELLEAASVAGATFAVETVAAGSGRSRDDIARQCDLWQRQGYFLEAGGVERWPDGTRTVCYRFRHDLYYEVLYDRLSAWRRLQLHRDIGLRKEAGYGDQSATLAAELARHFEQAQDAARATTYLQHAATTAAQRSAHPEAILHLRRALALLAALDPSPTRRHQEYLLQVALGHSIGVIKGWGDPEVYQAYAHAWALCQQMEVTPEHAGIFFGHFSCAIERGYFQMARTIAETLHQLAQQYQETDLQVMTCSMLGAAWLYLGDSLRASTYLTRALTCYDPQQRHHHLLVYGLDVGVTAASRASWALWLHGDIDQSRQCSQHALACGQDPPHAYSRAFALIFAACLALFRREAAVAHALAEATIALGHDYGIAAAVAEGCCIQGRALVEMGDAEQGIARMVEGLKAYTAAHGDGWMPTLLTLLADGYATVGRVTDGLRVVTEGLAVSERTRAHIWMPELHRLYGHLVLAQAVPDVMEAEAAMQQALVMARQQHSKTLELRTATSLARLWHQQGNSTAAYDLLAPVYAWFTEGFDTADLEDARALLDTLRPTISPRVA